MTRCGQDVGAVRSWKVGDMEDPDGIKTKFTPIEPSFLARAPWSPFYSAARDWILTYELVIEHPEKYITPFWAEGPIAAFALELSAKALAAYHDPKLEAKHFGHKTAKIIKHYRKDIPLFETIASDAKWIAIIREYQKWIDTKYGGHYMQMDRPEYERFVQAAYLVFNEIHDAVVEAQRVHREKVAADAAAKATNP